MLAAALLLLLLPATTSAAPRFADGNLDTSLQTLNCSSIILGSPYAETEVGMFVGQYLDDDASNLSPVVGEVFDVRIVVATIGNNCAGTAPQVEIALPPGVTPAVGGSNSIRCYSSTDYGNDAAWQPIPQSAGCPTTLGQGLTNHPSVTSWYGVNPNAATYGDALWKIGQGTAIQIQVPVVADRTMNGIGDTNGCVCVIASVKTTNGHAMPDASFTWASGTLQGTAYQPLFVFAGKPGATDPLPTVGAPSNATAPRILGQARVGRTLQCNRGRWGGAESSFAYAWQSKVGRAAWRAVPRATRASLRIAPSYRNAQLRCRVTATNSSGSVTATSRAVRVGTPPVRRSSPRVVGRAAVGARLTCQRGSWSGTAPIRYEFRWERRSGVRWVNVGGGARRTVVAADRRSNVRCVVTATNDAGRGVARSAPIRIA